MTQTPIELLRSERPAKKPVVALSEGEDPRIVAGALAATKEGFADVILVGDVAKVADQLSVLGEGPSKEVVIHDPATSELTATFAKSYHALRKHKGLDEAAALAAVQSPLVYAAMLVREGHASGTVGGAVATTSDVVRTAIQIIGKDPDAEMVSSFFLMTPPSNATPHARPMIYSDCGLVIDPTAIELASIASASAGSCKALLRTEPKIAMLSFSTKGSARHNRVTKVTDALAVLRAARPDLQSDGELQFDAAFVPDIGAKKAPDSDVAGSANVMIFPDLDSGNIAYKMTQRLGGYTAIGPILQGLAQPANDLSRGCTADDVTQLIAVTVLQSLERHD